MTRLQKLADEVRGHFETFTREGDSTRYWRVKDRKDVPEWITDLCHAAHSDMLPDDHKYEFIVDALDALAENEDPDDINLEPDIYNADLLRWVSSHLERSGYVEEAISDASGGVYPGFFESLMLGQAAEKSEVLYSVRSSLEAHIEDEPEDGYCEACQSDHDQCSLTAGCPCCDETIAARARGEA